MCNTYIYIYIYIFFFLHLWLLFESKSHPKHVWMMPKTCSDDAQNISGCPTHVQMMPTTFQTILPPFRKEQPVT